MVNSIEQRSPDSANNGTIEITYKTIGPARPSRIRVVSHIKKFKIPPSTSRWKKKLYYFMRNKLKLPDIILMGLFSVSLKMWVIITLWFIMAPVAQRWDLGLIFILGTGFSIILLNLGKRQPGDVSAYSIFNEDFRELPGTYNADRIDQDIRTGRI